MSYLALVTPSVPRTCVVLSASGSVLLPELLKHLRIDCTGKKLRVCIDVPDVGERFNREPPPSLIMPLGNCCVTTRNDFDPAQFPSMLVEFMRELNGFIC